MTEEKFPETVRSSELSEIPYAELGERGDQQPSLPESSQLLSQTDDSLKIQSSSKNMVSLTEIYGDPLQQDFDKAAQQQVARSALSGGQVAQALMSDSPLTYTPAPPIPEDLDNVAAVGGAVSSLVLGIWSIIGSFITTLSVINAFLGLLLGVWGFSSSKRWMAKIGTLLCLVGIFFSVGNSLGLSRGILYLLGL